MRILIVENDDLSIMLMKVLLERIDNIDITIARNGREAVDLCRNNYFNTIFMEIQTPIMDGFEAVKIIKDFRQDISIVALTTYSFDYINEDFQEAGFDHYIQKPVKVKVLKEYLDSIKN